MLLVFIGIWLTTMHFSSPRSEAYKKLLREKGEKLEIAEVLPPAVPPESNGRGGGAVGIRLIQCVERRMDEPAADYAHGRAGQGDGRLGAAGACEATISPTPGKIL